METDKHIKYAGFFYRFIAWVIDSIILSVPLKFLSDVFEKNSNTDIILFVLVWWLYSSYSIYKWKGTLGKRILGLYVLRTDTQSLSFKEASLRYIFSILIYIPIIVYLIISKNIGIENESLLWIIVFLTLIPFLMMFFNQKRQTLYDYLAKTIVVESVTNIIDQPHTIEITPNPHRKPTALQRGIGVIMGIFMLVFLAYSIFYIFVMYTLQQKSSNNYNASFHRQAKVNDYNDSKIIFYNKELEKYSEAFIHANGMYKIFATDTKKDLALDCIQASLQENNVSEWIKVGSDFRTNARNLYAKSEEDIAQAKKNAHYMGQHFYDFDLNEVNHIQDKIVDIWDTSKNKNTCDKLVPVSELFDTFMVMYIPNREEAISRYQRSLNYPKTHNKAFYRKEITKMSKWLDILYQKHPNIAEEILEFNKKKEEEAQKEREEKRKKALERKIELTWLASETSNLYTWGYYTGLDLNLRNKKGQTPLMIAVQNGFLKVIKQYAKGNIDASLKDNQGKTAFDYIKKAKNKEEQLNNEMIYKALKMIKEKKYFDLSKGS